MRTPWKPSCRCDDEEFQEEIKVAQKKTCGVATQMPREVQMAQTMTRSKVQNILKPDLEQTAAQTTDCSAVADRYDFADLEQTSLSGEENNEREQESFTEASPPTAR